MDRFGDRERLAEKNAEAKQRPADAAIKKEKTFTLHTKIMNERRQPAVNGYTSQLTNRFVSVCCSKCLNAAKLEKSSGSAGKLFEQRTTLRAEDYFNT